MGQANRVVVLCKYCKGIPHPSVYASLMSRYTLSSDTSTPKSFSQRFEFCHYFLSKINFDCHSISNVVRPHDVVNPAGFNGRLLKIQVAGL